VTQLKELRFHPNTDTHDFDFKVRHAVNFLKDGNKVKATVVFKGREITYKEKGEVLLTRFAERVADVAKVDQAPHMEGRSMIAIFAPERKKPPKASLAEDGKSDKPEEKPAKAS
jgi:translation initiation factor IF-3